MGLDSVAAADDQHRTVQNRQHPLRLRRKVHMPRGIHQGQVPALSGNSCLLGKNGDAPLPLQQKAIQKRVPMVHPSQHPPGAGDIQKPFGKGGLPRIHMGEQPNAQGIFDVRMVFGHKDPPFMLFP